MLKLDFVKNCIGLQAAICFNKSSVLAMFNLAL